MICENIQNLTAFISCICDILMVGITFMIFTKGFSMWKEQQLATKKMEFSESVLEQCYVVKTIYTDLRREYKKPYKNNEIFLVEAALQELSSSFEKHTETFSQFFSRKHMAEIYLGKEASLALSTLELQHNYFLGKVGRLSFNITLAKTNESLAEYLDPKKPPATNAELFTELIADIWISSDKVDKFSNEMKIMFNELETILVKALKLS